MRPAPTPALPPVQADSGRARAEGGRAATSSPVRIPLAATPTDLSEGDAAAERYRRTWLVDGVGLEGQARLAAARVLVVGAGGLASPVVMYLAAAGVGTLGICDSDAVEASNLQRQILHGEDAVGTNKAQSARRAVERLNSGVRTHLYGHVSRDWLEEHGGQWDLVVECTDTFAAKYMVADWCAQAGVPLVWGTVVAMSYQVSVFWSQPPPGLPATTLRMLHPRIPVPGTTPSAAQAGVLGPVVGQAGAVMATEAIKLITGAGQPLLGRVMVADAARGRFDVLPFAA